MEKSKSKILLLIGCQRSGTTLLSAMLGGHSEINMLFESTTNEVLRLIGKRYSANKLLAWRQIRLRRKSSKFGHLINRVVNFDLGIKPQRHHRIRVFPTSVLSIQDYMDKGAYIITIVRDKIDVIDSITTRTRMTRSQAESEYRRSMQIIEHLGKNAYHIQFHDLVHNPIVTLTGICEYLDLRFEERMLKGVEYNFVYPNSRILGEKSKLRQ